MRTRNLAFIFSCLGLTWLTACSLYESPARKFLDKNAYQYTGASATAADAERVDTAGLNVDQQNLLSCTEFDAEAPKQWVLLSASPLARVFVHENDSFELRVLSSLAPHFACDFRFASAQELFEKTGAAVDLTLTKSID